MNLHGGCASTEELENLDAEETAVLLISDNAGTVTPYGVVYDNGMKLEQIYDGKHLPGYHYDVDMLMTGITSAKEPEDTPNITWVYLPAFQSQIDWAFIRSGITDPAEIRWRFEDSAFPKEVNEALDFRQENIETLNALAKAVARFSDADHWKLGAAIAMAQPESAFQIRQLAENLHMFEFAPGVKTAEEYGRYMIQNSGHFEYDPNLEAFYDYEKYGLQRMEQESGQFTERGYVSYHGTMSLDELMMEDPAEQYRREQGLQMGGMA